MRLSIHSINHWASAVSNITIFMSRISNISLEYQCYGRFSRENLPSKSSVYNTHTHTFNGWETLSMMIKVFFSSQWIIRTFIRSFNQSFLVFVSSFRFSSLSLSRSRSFLSVRFLFLYHSNQFVGSGRLPSGRTPHWLTLMITSLEGYCVDYQTW